MLEHLALLALTAQPAANPIARSQAYYHFSLAQQARLGGQREEALAEFRRAIEVDPDSGEVRAELARLLRDSGRLEEAIAEGRKAVEVEPTSVAAHRVLAQLLQASADFGGAREALPEAAGQYERVLELEADDRMSLVSVAQIYGRLRRHEDAVRIWTLYVELDPGNFEAHQRLGAHLMELGRSEEAAAALAKALELEPDSAAAHQSLGDTYAQGQDAALAVEHYRRALELEPGDLLVRVKLGEVLLRADRFEEAASEAQAILEADENNRYALDLLGRSFREQRRLDEAADVVRRLRALDPDDLKAGYLQVTIAEARRDYAEAERTLGELLERDHSGEDAVESASNDRVFLVHMGFARQQQGRHLEAAEAFAGARALAEDADPTLDAYRVDALLQADALELALEEVLAARLRHPDDVTLLALEAAVRRKAGDLPAAVALVDGLVEARGTESEVLMTAAEFHQRGRDYARAEELLRQALGGEPASLRGLFQLGAVLERQGRDDQAEEAFRKALEAEPESAPVLNYLGYMNADRNVRVQEAYELISRAIAIDPQNGAYLDSLGWALFRLDRVAEAESRIREALAREGSNAVILDHLGDILKRKGDVSDALDQWRKALLAEDEDGELDRSVVERKIQEALAALPAAPE